MDGHDDRYDVAVRPRTVRVARPRRGALSRPATSACSSSSAQTPIRSLCGSSTAGAGTSDGTSSTSSLNLSTTRAWNSPRSRPASGRTSPPQSGLAVRRRGAGAGADTPAGRCGRHPVESPFVRSRWDVRRPPEEVHDDALPRRRLPRTARRRRPRRVAARGPGRPVRPRLRTSSGAPTNSDATSVATCWTRWARRAVARPVRDGVSNTAGAPHPERRRRGARRTGRGRRPARSGSSASIRDKLDVVLATTEVGEGDVYDTHEQYYVQKTGTESDAKRSRLQGVERQAGRSWKTKRPRSYTRGDRRTRRPDRRRARCWVSGKRYFLVLNDIWRYLMVDLDI